MGCGKSYFSKRLSDELHFKLFDTDSLIEAKYQKSIKDIFALHGETYFRSLESDIASDIVHFDNAIIATGGGFPIFYEDICTLGTVVYMDISFEDIIVRMSEEDISKRPLFQNLQEAQKLYNQRKDLYIKRSHFSIDASQSIETMIAETQYLLSM